MDKVSCSLLNHLYAWFVILYGKVSDSRVDPIEKYQLSIKFELSGDN